MSTSTEAMDLADVTDAVRGMLEGLRAQPLPARAAWAAMTEAGWPALAVAAEHGGLGQSTRAAAAMLTELGTQPFANPMLSAFTSTHLLEVLLGLASGGQASVPVAAVAGVLADALAGRRLVVAAGLEQPASLTPSGRLAGSLGLVADAASATDLLVVANDAEGVPGLFLVPVGSPDCSITAVRLWDATREMASVDLREPGVDGALRLLHGPACAAALAAGRAFRDLALAADAVGGGRHILALTIDYAKQRVQFGRPIASFQAIKHRCADLATEVTASESMLRKACGAMDARSPHAAVVAALARMCAAATYLKVTEEAVQMHGGIGFTWEHVCHHYLKRARSAEVLGGTLAQRQDALAAPLLAYLQSGNG